jgi:HK97 gp10 family phage protein
MATISFKAGDEYALKLSRLAAGSDDVAKKAIYEGAKVVADKIKSNLESKVSADATGDLIASFGITPIARDKDGNWNTKIGFDGYDRKGVPNQLKARVLESGSSRQQKKPFVRPAVNATKKKAIDVMKKVIDEETERLMGGK